MAGRQDLTAAAALAGRHQPHSWKAVMARHALTRGLTVRSAAPRDHGRIDVIVRARLHRPAALLGAAAIIARRRVGIAGPDGRARGAYLAEDADGTLRAYLIASSDDDGNLHIHEVASAPPGPGARVRYAATVLIGTVLAAAVATVPDARVSLVSLAEHRWLPGDAALVPPWRDPVTYYEALGLSRLTTRDASRPLGVAVRHGDIVMAAPAGRCLAAVDFLLRRSLP